MALIAPDVDAFLERVVQAMDPYLDELVVVGGCASALYRHHPLAQPFEGERPLTKDIDLVAPKPLPERAHRSMPSSPRHPSSADLAAREKSSS